MARAVTVACAFLTSVALAADVKDYLGFDPNTEADKAANAYIAQENLILFRMRYPNGAYREFERPLDKPEALVGGQGWVGRIVSADQIAVRSGKDPDGNKWDWLFKGGRCVAFGRVGENPHEFPYAAPRAAPGRTPPFYFGHAQDVGVAVGKTAEDGAWKGVDKKVVREFSSKWKRSRRLQWPFINPNENGCLFATMALLSVALFFFRSRWIRIAGGLVFVAASALLVSTASRGAMLALVAGLAPVFAFKCRTALRSKALWALAAIVILSAVVWFGTHNSKLLTRGLRGKSTWSNQVRLEMWKAAPQMMVEAPGGWAFARAGLGYFSWYQDLGNLTMTGSLMNEHLTRLVDYGWKARVGYVFAWVFGLTLLFGAAWRTRNAVPFGMWLAFAVAGWFNPVFVNWKLWIVPWASVGLFLCARPWRVFSLRFLLFTALGGVLAAAGLLAAIYAVGSRSPDRGFPIRVAKGRVCVNGDNPRTWIVDDGKALGGIMACRDIRGWYVYRPETQPVGYVRDVKRLPSGKIHRLVLAGEAGEAWMRRMSDGGLEMQRNPPDEVVFISPTFPPSALPDGFLRSCKVKYVVGEFAARYDEEFRNPPKWVTVVSGMELYHPAWMMLVADD